MATLLKKKTGNHPNHNIADLIDSDLVSGRENDAAAPARFLYSYCVVQNSKKNYILMRPSSIVAS
jgi:hypothetical protein